MIKNLCKRTKNPCINRQKKKAPYRKTRRNNKKCNRRVANHWPLHTATDRVESKRVPELDR